MLLQTDSAFAESAARAAYAASLSNVIAALAAILALLVAFFGYRVSLRATAASERATALGDVQTRIAARALDLTEFELFSGLLRDVAHARRALHEIWLKSAWIQAQITNGSRKGNIRTAVDEFEELLTAFDNEFGPPLRAALADDLDATTRVVGMLVHLRDVMRHSTDADWSGLDAFGNTHRSRSFPDRPTEFDQLIIEAREILQTRMSQLSARIAELQRRLIDEPAEGRARRDPGRAG
jgi:hypothetical protein